MNFFTRCPNLKKEKKNYVFFREGGDGGGGTRVSDFFFKRIQI